MNQLLQKIDELQKMINNKRSLNEIEQKELKDYFAIGLTYSSNALEGNSLTISETKVILEDGISVGGKPLKDILEAVGHKKSSDNLGGFFMPEPAGYARFKNVCANIKRVVLQPGLQSF